MNAIQKWQMQFALWRLANMEQRVLGHRVEVPRDRLAWVLPLFGAVVYGLLIAVLVYFAMAGEVAIAVVGY